MTEMTMQNLGEDADLLPLGERVAAWARSRGLTPKQISQRAQLDVRTARSVLEGNGGHPRTVDKLCEAYRVSFVGPVFLKGLLDDATIRLMELQDERQEIERREERLRALRERVGAPRRSRYWEAADGHGSGTAPSGREG